ncbi:MAG: phosphoribosylanthranilate isomerase [Alphaproteobacteria bacterium]|nr:phosphoribosylanthranilate isomerase [Alphaproteobacteria bacterium]
MSVAVKICGIRTAEAREAALRGGARWLGFVFYPPSPRAVAPEAAAALAAGLPEGREAVAVTVDADDGLLARIVEVVNPHLLQLHGSESPARVAAVRARFGRPVIKAIAVSDAASLAAARAFEPVADGLLFDAKAPKSAAGALPGGNGLAFDWQLLKGWSGRLPWFLSGGLRAETLGAAVALTGARRVDVSSGVESQPGVKAPALILDFLAAAGRADLAPAPASELMDPSER